MKKRKHNYYVMIEMDHEFPPIDGPFSKKEAQTSAVKWGNLLDTYTEIATKTDLKHLSNIEKLISDAQKKGIQKLLKFLVFNDPSEIFRLGYLNEN